MGGASAADPPLGSCDDCCVQGPADTRRLAVGKSTRRPSDLRWWAAAAIATLAVAAIVEVLAAAGEINYALTLDGILAGTESVSDFRDARDQVRAFELASLLVLALAAITFVAWFFLAYRNLDRVGTAGMRARPGWAIGGWLIPLVDMVLPKWLANDIWRGSEPGIDRSDPAWRKRSVAPLVHAWWLLWLTGIITGVVAAVVNDFGSTGVLSTPEEFERERTAFTIYAAAEFATAAAAVAAIRLVLAVTRRQRLAFTPAFASPPGAGGRATTPMPAPGAARRSPSPWAPSLGGGERCARPDE
jgi:hypothetical protein